MSHLFVLSCNGTATDSTGESADSVFGDMKYLWLVGVGCSAFSSLATAIGTILQKKAHNIQDALPDDQKSFELIGIVFNKYWMFALIIMVLIPLPFDFVSFALAPQSVIVPMTGLTIVLNQVFAPKLLGEKLTMVEVIGTAIILTGVIVIAVTAGGNPTEYNVCELVSRYKDPDVLGFVFSIISVVALCLFWVHTHRHPPALEKLRPEMYAFIAGGLGGLMNVAFKATGELVKGEVGPTQTNTWSTIWPYFHVLAVAVLAIGMISYINRGLQLYDAVLFTPLYFTNLIVCSSTLGLVYYREYAKFETWQIVVFPFGLVVVCAGILFMTIKGVDVTKVRARLYRLERSKENRKSMAASSRANGSQRTVGSRANASTRSVDSAASTGPGSPRAPRGAPDSPPSSPVGLAGSLRRGVGSLRMPSLRLDALRESGRALSGRIRSLRGGEAPAADKDRAGAVVVPEDPHKVSQSDVAAESDIETADSEERSASGSM